MCCGPMELHIKWGNGRPIIVSGLGDEKRWFPFQRIHCGVKDTWEWVTAIVVVSKLHTMSSGHINIYGEILWTGVPLHHNWLDFGWLWTRTSCCNGKPTEPTRFSTTCKHALEVTHSGTKQSQSSFALAAAFLHHVLFDHNLTTSRPVGGIEPFVQPARRVINFLVFLPVWECRYNRFDRHLVSWCAAVNLIGHKLHQPIFLICESRTILRINTVKETMVGSKRVGRAGGACFQRVVSVHKCGTIINMLST